MGRSLRKGVVPYERYHVKGQDSWSLHGVAEMCSRSGNLGKEVGRKEVRCPSAPQPRPGWGAGQSDGEVYARRSEFALSSNFRAKWVGRAGGPTGER